MTTNRLIAVLVAFLAIAALSAIVLVAIGQDRLWSLIGGVAVFGAVLILAGWMVARNIVVPLLDAKTKREAMRYDFLQSMAAKGALPNDGSFIPLHAQIAAPAQPQPKQGAVSQIIFNPNALRESAVNLLLFSMRQCGADQNRIASGPECAAAGVNGYTPKTWTRIVHEYLEPRYGVVTQRGNPDSGGGTFVPDAYGTVGALYNKVMTDAAVDALPGTTR